MQWTRLWLLALFLAVRTTKDGVEGGIAVEAGSLFTTTSVDSGPTIQSVERPYHLLYAPPRRPKTTPTPSPSSTRTDPGTLHTSF